MPLGAADELRKLQRYKQIERPTPGHFGEEMVGYFNHTLRPRQNKLARIAEAWIALVPATLCDHCALHGLSRGTLTVLVDSSTCHYELKQLLLAGLENQLLLACKTAGLRKISLKPGKPQ